MALMDSVYTIKLVIVLYIMYAEREEWQKEHHPMTSSPFSHPILVNQHEIEGHDEQDMPQCFDSDRVQCRAFLHLQRYCN